MRFNVQSETGQLRQVIVHRPGLELSRLTPGNVHELLFDDVMWAARARAEHDAFVGELESRGVVVHYFHRLLGEALADPQARRFLAEQVINEHAVGPTLVAPLQELAEASEPQQLANLMIGGLLKKDLPPPTQASLLWKQLDDEDFVLPPLPNHLFQRDNSAWVYEGVSINPMAKPARKRETVHSRIVYNFHPMFAAQRDAFAFYYGNDDIIHEPATCEGGDILVMGNGAVMVGLGERTTPQGAEILARNWFEKSNGAVRKSHRGRTSAAASVHAPRHGNDDDRRRIVHYVSVLPVTSAQFYAHARWVGRQAQRRAERRPVANCRVGPGSRSGTRAVGNSGRTGRGT